MDVNEVYTENAKLINVAEECRGVCWIHCYVSWMCLV